MCGGRHDDYALKARILLRRMLTPGTMCRSKDVIIRCEDEDQGRLCRVLAVVPQHRWRTSGVPEYKVELIALPVIAFRRDGELIPLPPADDDARAPELFRTVAARRPRSDPKAAASLPHS